MCRWAVWTRSESPDDLWWRSAVVYRLSRSFATPTGTASAIFPGSSGGWISAGLRGRRGLAVAGPTRPRRTTNGYDISDYIDIEPVGSATLADFDALLAAVHQRGMKLIMDLVVNHTSDEHPWFVESHRAPTNPKRDWYWWRPEPRPTGSRPSPLGLAARQQPTGEYTCTCSPASSPT